MQLTGSQQLRIALGGAGTPTVSATGRVTVGGNPGYPPVAFLGPLTGATQLTLLGPPDSGRAITLDSFNLYNSTGGTIVATPNVYDGTNTANVAPFQLLTGETLVYDPNVSGGWRTLDANGLPKTNQATTTSTASVITSTSANAFSAGPNGSTNPGLNVDASAGSAATGWNVAMAAAAAGASLAVSSSGANEVGNILAKGTSALKLNATTACTGAVQIGGAASGNNATGLTVTPAAAASGLAVAVVSTGANEKLTIDAKGSGTIVIGGTSTGILSLGRGSVSTAIFSGTKTTVNAQNATPTAAQLLGGYLSHNTQTAGGTVTLDTAANIDTAITGVANGDMFECIYANIGNQTGTITTATGLTLKGTVAVPAGKNAILDFFRTGSGAWDVVITVSA